MKLSGSLLPKGNSMHQKAIVFDRDGVLNEVVVIDGVPHPPESLADLVIRSGVREGIRRLRLDNYLIFCLTNQPDVARGKLDLGELSRINDFLASELGIQEFFVCPHDDSDNCLCRKPKPGGVNYFLTKYNLDPSETFVIGDRWKDIDAGNAAGCKTIHIDGGYSEKRATNYTFSTVSFSKAIDFVLGE
jgi:D-glycero-D-manno-heptose 1,7-bisphosphate phosphatase